MSPGTWMRQASSELIRSAQELRRGLQRRWLRRKRARGRSNSSASSYAALRDEVLATQWMAEDQLRAQQWTRLQALLDHVYRTTPYYRSLFDRLGLHVEDIRSLDDYRRVVPVLEKRHIRESFDDLISTEWRGRCYIGMTAGSTGMPVRYARPNPYPAFFAGWALVRDICGLTGREKRLHLSGRPLPDGRYHTFDATRNLHRFSFYHMPAEGMKEVLDLVLEWRPEFIYGYSSLLTEVAKGLERRGHTGLGVKAVQSHSEKLYAHRRETLQRVFGGQVFDHYGSSEIAHLGVDCPAHAGIHLFDGIRFFEIEPLPGQENTGELIVTDLHNYAQPYLRYRIGDVVTLDPSACTCGRRMPRAVVEGRSVDVIRLRDGGIICEDRLGDLIDPAQVEYYLFHQRSLDRVDIHLVPTDLYTEDYGERIVRNVRKELGFPDSQLFLDESIDTEVVGKHRLMLSDVSAEMMSAFNETD
jgi:phenylacetate-CoA ligase